jgi:flagellar basal body rod protein FlgC
MEPLSLAIAGLQAANEMFEQAAAGVIRAAAPPSSSDAPAAGIDTVELSTAMVSMLEARTSFEANVRVFQTADEMSRSTLDVLG